MATAYKTTNKGVTIGYQRPKQEDEKSAKIYEWENDKKVRFRAIINKQKEGPQLPLNLS